MIHITRVLTPTVMSDCEDGGVEVEGFDRREGLSFYEAVMGGELVERPAMCETCPRKWD